MWQWHIKESTGKVDLTVGLDSIKCPGVCIVLIRLILSGTIIATKTYLARRPALIE